MACRYPEKLEDRGPGAAGPLTWEQLAEWCAKYPHLKPCGMLNWNWVRREDCKTCRYFCEENENGMG